MHLLTEWEGKRQQDCFLFYCNVQGSNLLKYKSLFVIHLKWMPEKLCVKKCWRGKKQENVK